MRVLVTGGLGYLGSEVVHRLHERGATLVVFDNLDFGKDSLTPLLGAGRIELVEGDLKDIEKFPELCEGVHAVIHLAALTSDPTCDFDPDASRKINVDATRTLATMARRHGVSRFIFASSCSVYGGAYDLYVTEETLPQPLSLYARTKLECEEILHDLDSEAFCTTSLRLGTLFGWSHRMRFDLAVNLMTLHAVTKGVISVTGGGGQWRPFVHVKDVVKVVELVLDAPIEKVCDQVYNVGTNEGNLQIEDLAHRVQKQIPGSTVNVVPEDADPRSYRVHFDKIAKHLGFKANFSIEDGVKEIAAHIAQGEVDDPENARYHNMRRLMAKAKIPVKQGGIPVRSRFLPLARPHIGDEEKTGVMEAMDSGWLTTGPKTLEFEKAFAEAVKAPHAVAVSSCTAALHLALQGMGMGPGDEVITSPVTFASTANVVLHCGAKVVFADVDPLTLNISPEQILSRITDRTKAIIPVHIAGRPCPMREIHEIANSYNLHVIEDAAHAAGSTFEGAPIGSVSEVTCFSFYPSKNMTAAEGGMITVKNEELADKLRILRLHGMTKDAWKRYAADGNLHVQIVLPGYKNNMTDVQAAIGLAQLKKLEKFKQRRADIVRIYNDAFAEEKGLTLPPPPAPGDTICWHLYVVQLHLDAFKCTRDDFTLALRDENIGTAVHFISMHLQPYYRETFKFQPEDYPQANKISQRALSLPLFPDMTHKDVEDVVFTVKKLLAYFRR